MKIRGSVLLAFSYAALFLSPCSHASQPVLTRSYDNSRSGATTNETVLTPDNVSRLQRLFSLITPDDPRIEAQPLFVPHIRMNDNLVHDVVYVFSMSNSVYAFDANTGSAIWKKPVSLGAPYVPIARIQDHHRSTDVDTWGINIAFGVLSTPVIDLEASNIYVVNWVIPKGKTNATASINLRLHALRLSDGKEMHGGPWQINATAPGPGGTTLKLSQDQKQRAALLLAPLRGSSSTPAKKILYVTSTGGENPGSPHGWVVGFDVSSLGAKPAAWVSTPSSFGGGIWQGGQGPSADEAGNVYLMTGNGGFKKQTAGPLIDFSGKTDFAEAFVKLKYTTGSTNRAIELVDWFIPFRDVDRSTGPGYDYRDQDLGSAAPLVPAGTDLLLGAGKDGVLYVLNRNNLGKAIGDFTKLKAPPIFFTWFPGFNVPPTGDLDFPITPGFKTHHLHASAVFWNGPDRGPMLFDWGENECLRAWTLDTRSGVAGFHAKGAEIASADLADPTNSSLGGMTGGMLALSANGTNRHTGIVWATAPLTGDANRAVCPGALRAYDATVIDSQPNTDGTQRLKLLWQSTNAFSFSKFCPPFVANGKVFVATYDGRVDVYGLK